MKSLEELRKEIDSIDKEMLALFEKRMEVVHEITKYKLENGQDIFDREREEKVINKAILHMDNKALDKYIVRFFLYVMEISKEYQKDYIEYNT